MCPDLGLQGTATGEIEAGITLAFERKRRSPSSSCLLDTVVSNGGEVGHSTGKLEFSSEQTGRNLVPRFLAAIAERHYVAAAK